MSAEVYCCCEMMDAPICEQCGKAEKIGATQKVEVPGWVKVPRIIKPLIRR